ncbi:tRNA-dihydrouridine(20) synthase [NAD(P)+]-like, partial [Cladochytrium tenue]
MAPDVAAPGSAAIAVPMPEAICVSPSRRPGHVDLDYRGKLILAPMVRVGTLPMRLLSLKYGADIVYSPETIDRRLMRARRVVNPITGAIDFVDEKDGSVNLRVHPSEKDRLVVQIGSSDPEYAVAAALAVANDAAGIDLNCGCPKRFSVVSAMGAALLSDPDRLCAILTALVQNVPLPITCKIRMLDSTEKTIELAKRIEQTGVSAIGLHCRTRQERPQNPGHWDIFEPVARALQIPLIANGDIFDLDDVRKLKDTTVNFSVFSGRARMISSDEAVLEYTKKAIELDMPFHNAKYTLSQMWPGDKNAAIVKSKSYSDLCTRLGILDFYQAAVSERARRAVELGRPDLITAEVVGLLGADCPYIPDAPLIPSSSAVARGQNCSVTADVVACGDDGGEVEGIGSLWDG